MRGERLGRLSLRTDALYCCALGILTAVAAPVVDASVGLPALLLVVVGLAAAGWGVVVWWTATRVRLELGLRVVMVANVAAAAGLALTGMIAGTAVLALCACALGVDVAAFATSQGVALRRLNARPN